MDAPAAPSVPQVTIDDDQGVAHLRIPGTLDPAAVDADALIKLAQQSQVAIDQEVEARLAEAVQSFRDLRTTIDCVIAERLDPVDGEDGWLEWMEGYAPAESIEAAKADTDGSGRVDHYNRINYIKVSGETHVATIHPATRGEDGCDVRGRPIRPEAGKPCSVRVDRSLDVRSGRVLTRGDGVLEFADSTLRVSRLFEVEGWVDFATGNIDFDGTVVVNGGVHDRFAIRATEAIVVDGHIQSARLECNGNLLARCGVTGRERGLLAVGGTMEAGYLNYARGTIAGDLIVERELINCRLDVGGELHGERAVVIGGDSTVRHSAHLGRLGSPREKATTLVVGRIAVLGRDERLQGRLEAQYVDLVARHGEPPPLETDRPVSRSRRGRRGVEDRIRELQKRIEWCRIQHEELVAAEDDTEVVLDVATVIHPGVRLLVGPFEVNVKTPLTGPLRIDWRDRHEPHITSGGAPARPLAHVAETRLRAA